MVICGKITTFSGGPYVSQSNDPNAGFIAWDRVRAFTEGGFR